MLPPEPNLQSNGPMRQNNFSEYPPVGNNNIQNGQSSMNNVQDQFSNIDLKNEPLSSMNPLKEGVTQNVSNMSPFPISTETSSHFVSQNVGDISSGNQAPNQLSDNSSNLMLPRNNALSNSMHNQFPNAPMSNPLMPPNNQGIQSQKESSISSNSDQPGSIGAKHMPNQLGNSMGPPSASMQNNEPSKNPNAASNLTGMPPVSQNNLSGFPTMQQPVGNGCAPGMPPVPGPPSSQIPNNPPSMQSNPLTSTLPPASLINASAPNLGMPPQAVQSSPAMLPTSQMMSQARPNLPPKSQMISQPSSGLPPQISPARPSQPSMGMQPPMSQSGPGLPPTMGMQSSMPQGGPSMPPTSHPLSQPPNMGMQSAMSQARPGLPPTMGMQPPISQNEPGIPPTSQPISQPSNIGMQPMSQARPGLPPMNQPPIMGMQPPMSQSGPGIPPTSQQLSQPLMGMQPPMSQARPGLPPTSQQLAMGMQPPMSQPGPGFPPISQHMPMGQPIGMQVPPMSQPGMPPTSQQMPMSQSGPGMPPTSQLGSIPPMPGGYQAPQMPSNSQMGACPPMPGMPPMSPSGANQPMGNQYPGAPLPPTNQMGAPGYPGMPQTQTRNNADLMPSAVDVIEKDRASQSGPFHTGQRNVVPPLVTTDFACRDEGNSNPRFIRSSLYAVPSSSDLIKQVGIPFSITSSPFAKIHPTDQPLMISEMGPQGPVRCVRCKAYMCPYMTFIDGGRRFQCALCGASTEVSQDYFAHVDHTGRRIDTFQRPELCLGSYELAATAEYCRNQKMPKPPAYIFVLDVSQSALRSGLISLFCSRFMSDIIPNLPKDEYATANQQDGDNANQAVSDVSVGFITYDHQLHFYSFASKQVTDESGATKTIYTKPQMNIVADTKDMFVPGVEGFLIKSDNKEALQTLLELIPNQFIGPNAPQPQPDPLLAPAIQAGLEALKAAERPGKLFVLHSSLPTAEAPGRLKNRDDRKVIGTEKEKILLQKSGELYTEIGQACINHGCSVDLFLMPNSYVDLATISEVSKYTGGRIYKYPCFQADGQGENLLNDLRNAVSSPRAFDCVMRVRTSTGTRPVSFFGHCYTPNTTEIEVGSMDTNWSITSEIKHDDRLPEGDVVFIQAAILYTALNGQRRLRIHNLSLATTSSPAEVFRLADLDTHFNWLVKSAAVAIINRATQQVTDDLTSRVATTLAAYRRQCDSQTGPGSAPSNPGELVLPESMKLLPLLTQCLMKSEIMRPAYDISIDDRSLMMYLISGMSIAETAAYFYPQVLPLHNLKMETEDLPVAIRCSYERLKPDGVYLIDNRINLIMWLGSNVSSDWLQSVFDVPVVQQLPETISLTENSSDLSKRVNGVINTVRQQHSRFCPLKIIRKGDKQEQWVRRFMYEDRMDVNGPSYVNYLCHVHKEVRSLLK